VLNQSLAAATPTDPVLAARAAGGRRYLTEVATTLSERLVVLPRVAEAPVGAVRLRALVAESSLQNTERAGPPTRREWLRGSKR